MPSPILARADALMQRRHHTTGEPAEVPTLVDAIGDDEIPVLLDVETPAETVATAPASTEKATGIDAAPPQAAHAANHIDPELREQWVSELALRLEHRLLAELPRLIESTVRDLLAEQTMLDGLPPAD